MTDSEGYPSIREHSFFDNINWDTLAQTTPPPIYPYLPGTSESQELRSHYKVPDHLEPGLDDKQLTRLLGLDLQTPSVPKPKKKTSICDLTNEEISTKLQTQMTDNKWHSFVEGNLILKQGFVEKRKVRIFI